MGYEGDGIQCSVIAVLVLSTLKPTNRPMLVSFVGKSRGTDAVAHEVCLACFSVKICITRCNFNSGLVDDNLDFDYGNEESIDMGCAVTLRDQMWYLGGDGAYQRQVSSETISQIQITYS